MNYLITPPNTHYDGGIGITACNFTDAATSLKKNNGTIDGVLPFCYLQRHAIELYLKSLIVILHKKFSLPYGDGFSEDKPAIKVQEKWVFLAKTHNLNDLYNYFTCIFTEIYELLPKTTLWEVPDEIRKKINLVNGTDPKSTYFRYPHSTNTNQDSKKSTIQKSSFESMVEKIESAGKPMKCVLMLDENDDVVETYDINHAPIPNVIKALEDLNIFFYGIHAAFRGELTGGA